jgi:hypothetical protein
MSKIRKRLNYPRILAADLQTIIDQITWASISVNENVDSTGSTTVEKQFYLGDYTFVHSVNISKDGKIEDTFEVIKDHVTVDELKNKWYDPHKYPWARLIADFYLEAESTIKQLKPITIELMKLYADTGEKQVKIISSVKDKLAISARYEGTRYEVMD